MDIYELHKWLDLCEHEDANIRKQAQGIVAEWENDIQPGQLWRMKEQDDAMCEIITIGNKKVKVKVSAYSDDEGPKMRTVYFGRASFFKKWERML